MAEPKKGPVAADDDADLRPVDLSVAWRLLPYVRPHLRLLAVSALVMVSVTGFGLLGPWLVGQGIDAVTYRDGDGLARAALFLGVVSLGHYATRALQGWLLVLLGQRVLYDLRLRLFSHLEAQSLAFFQRWPVGRLMTRVTGDVEALSELVSSGLITIGSDLITIVGVAVVLLVIDLELGLLGLSALPFLTALVLVMRRPIRAASRAVRRRVAELAAFTHERIQGARVVRTCAAEEEDLGRFDVVNDAACKAYFWRTHLDALHNPGVYAVTACAMALVLWRGGEAALEGRIRPGELMTLLLYLNWLYMPIRDLASKYTLFQQGAASSERIFELLDHAPEVKDPDDPLPLPSPLKGEIALEGVTFGYLPEPAPRALQGITLRVRAGETLAVVGPTGSGKSTLASLVLRLWDPQEGTVRLDGVDLRRLRQSDLRGRMALVLQDVFLFSGTIGDNIALANPGSGVDRAAIERAARAVAAHEVIERLGGYDAKVGERGVGLSQGERQLISFARALCRDPAVLVLDEATASIDPETEARLQAGVRALCAGRTSIVIAHRLATVEAADRIVVLEKGRIAEEGTHAELLAKGGTYARWIELQATLARG